MIMIGQAVIVQDALIYRQRGRLDVSWLVSFSHSQAQQQSGSLLAVDLTNKARDEWLQRTVFAMLSVCNVECLQW